VEEFSPPPRTRPARDRDHEEAARQSSIVSQLTQHGLIDEYQFVVCPILLASGRPLLSGVSRSLRQDLPEAKKYQSGDVMLRYARPN
jgi:dihydrofolate reductase